LTINLKLSSKSLKVNSTEKITVTTLPGASVHITVTYANHKKKTHSGTAGGSGVLKWSYKQPAGTTTSKSKSASVHAAASLNGQHKSSTKRYSIK
jgi:hypothetical protein